MGDDSNSARLSPDLAFACFVWGNLLFSNKPSCNWPSRSSSDGKNGDDDEDDEDEECDPEDNDAPDSSNAVRTASHHDSLDLLQEKFLDALSGVLLRQKGREGGWRFARAACLEKHAGFITIVVARNHGFDLKESNEEREYLKAFETFMASCPPPEDGAGHESSLTETFLEMTLGYGYMRHRSHIYKLRKILSDILPKSGIQQSMENMSPAQELLVKLKVLVLQDPSSSNDGKDQIELVKLAYQFQKSPIPLSVLSTNTGVAMAQKLSRQLRLMAKPMVACKTFAQLATAVPDFRTTKVITLDPPNPIQLNLNHRSLVEKTWSDLNIPELNTDKRKKHAREEFEDYCKTGLAVHPEIQLALYYNSPTQLSSNVLPYIGSSEIPCRLCEEFLKENLGIRFRMCHGRNRILPRWSIPKNKLESYLGTLEQIGSHILKDFNFSFTYPSLKEKVTMPETVVETGSKANEVRMLREAKRRASQQDPDPRQRRRSFLRLRMDGPRYFDKDEIQPWSRTISMQDRCVGCGNFATAQCQKCKNCKYCSKNCQERDWPIHRKVCRKFAKIAVDATEKGPIMLFVPSDGSRLSLLRLNVEPYVDEHEYRGIELSQATRFVFKHQLPQSKIIKRNIYDNEDFGFTLVVRTGEEIVYNDHERDSVQNPSEQPPTNILVNELISMKYGKPRAPADWRGSLLIMKEAPRSPEADPEEEPQYQDFLPRDLNLMIDHFVEFGNENVDRKFPATRPTTKGVKVTFNVDRENISSERYESVDVPLDYPIWDQSPTQVSEKVGFPIITRRYIREVASEDGVNQDSVKRAGDGMAIWLHLDLKEDAGTPDASLAAISDPQIYGKVPATWANFVGSLILVRQGRQPLLLEQAKAMCDFCQQYLRPLFETYHEFGSSSFKNDVQEKVSPSGFQKYLSAHQRNFHPAMAEFDSAVEHEDEL